MYEEFQTVLVNDFDDNGILYNFQVEVILEMEKDWYGADADGNRGTIQEVLKDWSVESIQDLGTGEDVTEKWKDNENLLGLILKEIS